MESMDTIGILTGSTIISLLHAIIPSHWLPVLAIGRQEKWPLTEVVRVTFFAAFAHTLSTIAIGVVLGMIGQNFPEEMEHMTHHAGPVILILMGVFFVYRHYTHRHFHLANVEMKTRTKTSIILSLSLAMFLSPCMEIEAYFLLAGAVSGWLVGLISLLYFVITIAGMLILVSIAYKGLMKFDSHKIEHNAGIITGLTLIATGLFSFFTH